MRSSVAGSFPGTDIASQGNISTFQERTEFRDQALFAGEQLLAFDERLILSAGIRADRSSANGDQAHFYLFPRCVGRLPLRAAASGTRRDQAARRLGAAGNRPRYGDRDILLSQGSLIDGQPSTVNRTTVGNSDVKPETLTEVTAGVDVSAFDQRVLLRRRHTRAPSPTCSSSRPRRHRPASATTSSTPASCETAAWSSALPACPCAARISR